jgi:hypothetical protein
MKHDIVRGILLRSGACGATANGLWANLLTCSRGG